MTPDLLMNGFRVKFSSSTFTAYVREMPRNEELRSLRERMGRFWFLYWREGQVFGLPRVPKPEQTFGKPVELTFEDHPQLLAARIADILPEKFPKYRAFRRRPFAFLSQKNEIVDLIRNNVDGLPDILDRLRSARGSS